MAGAIEGGITATFGRIGGDGGQAGLSVAGLYRYLMSGYNWAESAYMCLPQLSGDAVVIGDPLYTPFK